MFLKVRDSGSNDAIHQSDVGKGNAQLDNDKGLGDFSKEKPSKKNRRKEKENPQKSPVENLKVRRRRLLVLPFEASVIAILLLILMGGFYVVSELCFSLS